MFYSIFLIQILTHFQKIHLLWHVKSFAAYNTHTHTNIVKHSIRCAFAAYLFRYHIAYGISPPPTTVHSIISYLYTSNCTQLYIHFKFSFVGFCHMQYILCSFAGDISFILENLSDSTKTNTSTASQANSVGQQ